MKKFFRKYFNWFWLWFPLFMLAALPVFATWNKDRFQVTLVDLALPLILALVTSIIITLIFYWLWKRNIFAGLLSATAVTYILDQHYSSKLSDFLHFLHLDNQHGPIQSTIFFVLIIISGLLVGWLIYRLLAWRNWRLVTFAESLTIVVVVAFILEFYPAVKSIIIEWRQFFYRPPAISDAMTTKNGTPDIYYIVLDRYTSDNVLSSQFNFDNSGFTNFLKSNDFSVDPAAKDNYPFTAMSIASTLNASYDSDMVNKFSSTSQQTVQPYMDAIRQSSVISKLKSLGYKYIQLGSWYEATNFSPLADEEYQPQGQLWVLNQKWTLNNFSENLLYESLYWPIIQHSVKFGNFKALDYSAIGQADATKYKLNLLNQLAAKPAGGRFIFAHIISPHDPYYFNADGTLNKNIGSDDDGEPQKEKYTNQVEFLNSQMEAIIKQILAGSDGKAIVVIQSDEGPYPLELNDSLDADTTGDNLDSGDMTDWSPTDLQMKYGILAAYHVPGATAADFAVGGNSVDIFRLIFNLEFGAKMPYLPECYFAYPNGRSQPFVYKNINQVLTGSAAPSSCPTGG